MGLAQPIWGAGALGQCSWLVSAGPVEVGISLTGMKGGQRGAEVQQLSGRRWKKESRIGVTEKEGLGNYIAKEKNL